MEHSRVDVYVDARQPLERKDIVNSLQISESNSGMILDIHLR